MDSNSQKFAGLFFGILGFFFFVLVVGLGFF